MLEMFSIISFFLVFFCSAFVGMFFDYCLDSGSTFNLIKLVRIREVPNDLLFLINFIQVYISII